MTALTNDQPATTCARFYCWVDETAGTAGNWRFTLLIALAFGLLLAVQVAYDAHKGRP